LFTECELILYIFDTVYLYKNMTPLLVNLKLRLSILWLIIVQ